MELRLVNPDDLWEDSRGNTLWYNNGTNTDFYLIINLYEIVAFYIIVENKIIYGEPGKAPLFSKIYDSFDIIGAIENIDKSKMSDVIPSDFLEYAMNVPNNCDGLDFSLTLSIQSYLSGEYNALYLRPEQLVEAEKVLNSDSEKQRIETTFKFLLLPFAFVCILFSLYIALFSNPNDSLDSFVNIQNDKEDLPLNDYSKNLISDKGNIKNKVTNIQRTFSEISDLVAIETFNNEVKILLNSKKGIFEKDSDEFSLYLTAKYKLKDKNAILAPLEKLCDSFDVCFPLADYWFENNNQKAAFIYYKRDCEKYGGKICELANCSSTRSPASDCQGVRQAIIDSASFKN